MRDSYSGSFGIGCETLDRIRTEGSFVALVLLLRFFAAIVIQVLTLSVLIGELERLHQAQDFVNGAADGQIVNGDLSQDTVAVDDVQSSERNSVVLLEDIVSPGDRHALVGE